jgi:putative MATE family efflux protein
MRFTASKDRRETASVRRSGGAKPGGEEQWIRRKLPAHTENGLDPQWSDRIVILEHRMQAARSLTEGSISRHLLLFALPALLSNALLAINGSVSFIWIGRLLGEAALTASANGNAVIFVLFSSTQGIAAMASLLVGQRIGALDPSGARRVMGTSVILLVALSAALASAAWLVAESLLVALGTPAGALPLAVTYMRVLLPALPIMSAVAFLVAALQTAGDYRTPFVFVALSAGLHVVLSPLLVFGVAGAPGLGIGGAALATCIAQGASLAALLAYLHRRGAPLSLIGGNLRVLRVDWRLAAVLVRKGMTMGLALVVSSVSSVLMFRLVNRFGVETAAAYGAALQLWTYIQMPQIALATAVSAMAAQNIGAGKWSRVAATTRVGLAGMLLVTGTLIALLEIFGANALSMFLPAGSSAIGIAERLNGISVWSFVFFGISMIMFGTMRAAGQVLVPLLILSCSLLAVRYPLAELMLDRWQADAIWWSFPISAVVCALLAMLSYRFGGWRKAGGAPQGAPPPAIAGPARPAARPSGMTD